MAALHCDSIPKDCNRLSWLHIWHLVWVHEHGESCLGNAVEFDWTLLLSPWFVVNSAWKWVLWLIDFPFVLKSVITSCFRFNLRWIANLRCVLVSCTILLKFLVYWLVLLLCRVMEKPASWASVVSNSVVIAFIAVGIRLFIAGEFSSVTRR